MPDQAAPGHVKSMTPQPTFDRIENRFSSELAGNKSSIAEQKMKMTNI
jgi:hypothetical protein